MNYEKFTETIEQLAPDRKADAVPIWRDFAAECVDRGQFVHFEEIADKAAAVETWLDVLSAGFRAVSESFGEGTAAAVVNLSCEHCCLYPGEMMQAAVYLENGGNGKQLLAIIESGELECPDLFEPMSRQEAEKYMLPTDTEHYAVSAGMGTTTDEDQRRIMKKYFDYLEELRDSGRTNMYTSVPWLLNRFPELFGDTKRAGKILQAWMDSYRTGGEDR